MPTVLVVEDERDIRELLRRYLERAGLSVLTTGTGAENQDVGVEVGVGVLGGTRPRRNGRGSGRRAGGVPR